MSWATNYIQKLKNGETVSFRPKGNSMTGKINNGDLVTVEPIGNRTIEKGDIVLCKVGGYQYLHLVTAIKNNNLYQISNNHGHINGWCSLPNIYGIVTKVES